MLLASELHSEYQEDSVDRDGDIEGPAWAFPEVSTLEYIPKDIH